MNYFYFLTTFQYSLTAGTLGGKYRAFILPGTSTWSAFGRCWSPLRLCKFSHQMNYFCSTTAFLSHEHDAPAATKPQTCEILFYSPMFWNCIPLSRCLYWQSGDCLGTVTSRPTLPMRITFVCIRCSVEECLTHTPLTECHRTDNYHTGMYTPSLSLIRVNGDVFWRRTGKTFPFLVAANVAFVSRNQSESFSRDGSRKPSCRNGGFIAAWWHFPSIID